MARPAVPSWLPICAVGFLLGRASVALLAGRGGILLPSPTNYTSASESSSPASPQCNINQELQWKLDMRRARSYPGITVPMHNGYEAKCIPDSTMGDMNAKYERHKLKRTKPGLSDGLAHEDDNLLSVAQVGAFAAEHLKLGEEGRPIWTLEIWNNFLKELDDGFDGGPPGYRDSGTSVSNAVFWALENALPTCGAKGNDPCNLSVFSAISPWAEAILHWTASKLRRSNVRITSVDFNPCILKGIPPNTIAECISTLDLVQGSGAAFDLTVSYSGIEHDGLGRYGDPVNPNGDVSAMREMWLLTRPLGILLLAIPRAPEKIQPKTKLPIWSNGKIQVLQHREYGAERYMRLLVGWHLEGFVISGGKVAPRRNGETKLQMLHRMIQCSSGATREKQPLLILRKPESMTFDDVMREGEWSDKMRERIEKEYQRIRDRNGNATTCS